MAEKFVNRRGKIRLYDGTGTPFYLELAFDAGDLSHPTGRNLPEEIAVQDRGRHDANAHYIGGSEECFVEALEASFSLLVNDTTNFGYFMDWIECLNGDASTVNSNTILTTKGDTQNDGSNNNPAFYDTNKKACNIEYLLDGLSSDLGWQLNECYIPYPSNAEGDDAVTLSITPMIYGTITRITAFTAGTDVTA